MITMGFRLACDDIYLKFFIRTSFGYKYSTELNKESISSGSMSPTNIKFHKM